MNCSTMYGSDAEKAPGTKWQAGETCTGSLIFAGPPAGRIRKNCLLGEASQVPFEQQLRCWLELMIWLLHAK